MSTDEYVPSETRDWTADAEETIRLAATDYDTRIYPDDWPDWIARVKRDAWNEGWTAELDDNNPYEETP